VHKPFLAAVVSIALLSSAAAGAPPAAYTFTTVIDSTTGPALSPYSTFALDGSTVAVLTPNEILKVDSGVRTSIAKVGDAAPSGLFAAGFAFNSDVHISNGLVAFRGTYPGGGSGFFTGSGGPLTAIAKSGDVTSKGVIQHIPIEGLTWLDGSTSTFPARLQGGGATIFRGGSGGLTPIVSSGDPAPVGTFNSASSFGRGAAVSGNNVAFNQLFGPPLLSVGIFIGEGGALTTVAKTGDMGPNGPINNIDLPLISGSIVVFPAASGSVRMLLKGNDGPLTAITKVGDPAPNGTITDFAQGGIANNGNDILYRATWAGGGSGVFLNSGGVTTSVIQQGATLFGQPLQSVSVSGQSLDWSGSGKVAFRYVLANGVEGIALATPVPEPHACALLAVAAVVGVRRRRR
jgi:hypothetical protein